MADQVETVEIRYSSVGDEKVAGDAQRVASAVSDANALMSRSIQQFAASSDAAKARAEAFALVKQRDGQVTEQLRQAILRLTAAETANLVETLKAEQATNRATDAKQRAETQARKTTSAYTALRAAASSLIAALSFNKIIDAADSFTKMNNQLKLTVAAGQDVAAVFKEIMRISLATQTPMEQNVRLFRAINNSLRDTLSQADQLKVLDTISKSMYAFGNSGRNAEAALEQLAQAFQNGKLQAEEWKSLTENAPGVLFALARGLGITDKALNQYRKTQGQVSDQQKKMKDDLKLLDNVSDKQLRDQKTRVADTSASISKLSAQGKSQSKEYTALVEKQRKQTADLRQMEHDRFIYATEVSNATQNMLKNNELSAQLMANALLKANAEMTKLAAAADGTVRGALTNLTTQFAFYIGTTDKATGGTRALVGAINVLGNNLNIVIPLVGAFVAALAVSAFVRAASDVAALAASVVNLGKALAAFTASHPWLVMLALAATAVGLLVEKLYGWDNVWKAIVAFWNGTVIPTWNTLVTTITNGVTNIVESAKAIWNFFVGVIEKINAATAAVQAFISSFAGKAISFAVQVSGGAGNAPLTQPPARNGADFVVPGGGPVDSRQLSMMVSPGERVIVQTPMQAKASNDNMPHFRDGGSITMGLRGVSLVSRDAGTDSIVGYSTQRSNALANAAAKGDRKSADDLAASIASSMSVYSLSPLLFARTISAVSFLSGQSKEALAYSSQAAGLLSRGMDALLLYGAPTAAAVKSGPVDVKPASIKDLQDEYVKLRNTIEAARGGMSPDARAPMFDRKLLSRISELEGLGVNKRDVRIGGPIVNGGIGRFRDGGSFVVPGGGAVDSRMINMRVSPGEEVSVRTPTQQRDGEGERRSAPIYNIKIQSNDPDTVYRRSARQVAEKVGKNLRRVAGG